LIDGGNNSNIQPSEETKTAKRDYSRLDEGRNGDGTSTKVLFDAIPDSTFCEIERNNPGTSG
jgi:hypothetical protein